MRLIRYSYVLAVVLATASSSRGQGLEFVQAHYDKYEYKIAMRDGARLFTVAYVPKHIGAETYPIMLLRTPYSVGPYGIDRFKSDLGPSPIFGRSLKYIYAYQDVRGKFMSEGEFVNMRPHLDVKKSKSDIDESSDTFDTIDWLVKNVPSNNGKAGMWGISYPGFYVDAGIIDAHPALVAASPQAPVTDWFIGDDWHHNGALFLPHAYNFLKGFGRPRPVPTAVNTGRGEPDDPDGYRFFLDMGPLKNINERIFKNDIAFWNELMRHGTYDDFWKARNIRPHLKNIKPAVMTVGGWFDAENLFGALETYKTIERTSPGAKNFLVMGPWTHGGWSRADGAMVNSVSFRQKTAEFYRSEIEYAFFNAYLAKAGAENAVAEATVFETGANRWQRYAQWPPASAKPVKLYLRAGSKLAFEPPAGNEATEFDEYVSDPAKPAPYLNVTTFRMAGDYMAADQRHAAQRPDVLTYQTDVLDRDVTLAGPIKALLHLQSTGTDADFVVKLIDVYPADYPDPEPNPTGVKMGGYQQLVRGDVMRAKFRESFEKPSPIPVGTPFELQFAMQDILHTFRPGHRIMVQVQSSWFPLVDRNPQTFTDIPSAADADFVKATQRVYHSRRLASQLEAATLDSR